MHDYMKAVLPPADAEGDVRVNLDGMVRLLLDTYPSAQDDQLVLYFHPEDRAQAAGELARLRADRAETRRLFEAGELPEVLHDPIVGCARIGHTITVASDAFDTRTGLFFTRDVEHEQMVCVVGLITNEYDEVLLIRSKKPGRAWELPGGKKKRGETWRAATLREIKEETGVEPNLATGAPLAALDGIPVASAGYPSLVLIVAGKVDGDAAWRDLRPGGDAVDAGWFALADIPWPDLSKIGSAETLRAYAVQMGLPEVAR